jgi:phage tail-like protein
MPNNESGFYPPVGFYFKVNIIGISGVNEGSFQEVSGLNVKLGTEEIKEGGENRFTHRLPSYPKYENLVLKRGMLTDSSLITWARKAIEQFTITPTTVVLNLMDEQSSPLATWKFVKAYPVGIKVSDFKAQENAIVVETLELCFDYFERVK